MVPAELLLVPYAPQEGDRVVSLFVFVHFGLSPVSFGQGYSQSLIAHQAPQVESRTHRKRALPNQVRLSLLFHTFPLVIEPTVAVSEYNYEGTHYCALLAKKARGDRGVRKTITRVLLLYN